MDQLVAGSCGFVGNAVCELFPLADKFDIKIHKNYPDKEYDFCHVCTPTPMNEDGSCNISAVEDVVKNIKANIFVIRSTVEPGTTDKLEKEYGKNLVFQPEYIASHTKYPAPMGDAKQHSFIILGGKKENTRKVHALYNSIYPPTCNFFEISALTAEIIKLAENCFIASKVTYAQELYEICKAFGVDYGDVQHGVFRLDWRINPYWTNIYLNKRGFSDSSCLPKDINDMIKASEKVGYDPLFLKSILDNNKRWENE